VPWESLLLATEANKLNRLITLQPATTTSTAMAESQYAVATSFLALKNQYA